MPQAAYKVPAVHNQSTSPDAKSSPGLGQPGVFEAGASGPDLADKPVCDQPTAETQDDKSADLPLREDAHTDARGLSESSMAPAGTAAIPKQPQARTAPSSLIHGPAGTSIDSPDAPGPAGAVPSSPALPGLSSFSTSPRTLPPSPTPATDVLGALLGSYASVTPTPEPELPTADALQKPQTAAAASPSDFSEQAPEHSEHDADAHPLNTPQAAPPATSSSMPVPDQAPAKPSYMATPSTRAPASGEEEAAAPQSPKAPLLGLSEKMPLPPLVLSPTRLPRPARTPEAVPSKPLPLTNPSDGAVPAPTISANVSEIQPSGQPGGQPSGQPGGQPSGQPSGQSSGQPSGAVQQLGGQAESVPGSIAVSMPPGTNASEAVGEAAGAAAAEHVEADTGECGGLGCTFCAAQNKYLQHVMFVPVCQHCMCNSIGQHNVIPCNISTALHPCVLRHSITQALCRSPVCTNDNCLDSMCSNLDISPIAVSSRSLQAVQCRQLVVKQWSASCCGTSPTCIKGAVQPTSMALAYFTGSLSTACAGAQLEKQSSQMSPLRQLVRPKCTLMCTFPMCVFPNLCIVGFFHQLTQPNIWGVPKCSLRAGLPASKPVPARPSWMI